MSFKKIRNKVYIASQHLQAKNKELIVPIKRLQNKVLMKNILLISSFIVDNLNSVKQML